MAPAYITSLDDYLVSLTHQEIEIEDTSPSVIEFCIDNPQGKHCVQLEVEDFIHNDNKSYLTISKFLLSSSLQLDSKAHAWVILEIMSKTCAILNNNITERNKTWLINVEILIKNNRLLGHSCPGFCCFCFKMLPVGWSKDCCGTCCLDMLPTKSLYVTH